VIQLTCHVAIQESDISSCPTGKNLCVSKKLLHTICDVGHPHEMVFVEPSHVFLDEMVWDQDDCLALELRSLPGVGEITIGVGALFSLSSEVDTNLFGHALLEDVRWVDGWVTEVKHAHILLLFGYSVNHYAMRELFLPQMTGRVFLVCMGCWVLWGRACHHCTVQAWKWHWEWDKMRHLQGNSFHPYSVCYLGYYSRD
jgi:hypothetical protein